MVTKATMILIRIPYLGSCTNESEEKIISMNFGRISGRSKNLHKKIFYAIMRCE